MAAVTAQPQAASDEHHDTGGWLGRPLKRKEDIRFLTGRGQYVDDIVLPGMLHAAMLRSPHAHALIKRIDYSRALEMPGVFGVITGQDVAAATEPERSFSSQGGGSWYYMAVDRVRFVGEIVAIVAAEDRYLAEDAVGQIEVEYEPLPVVWDPERAADPDQPALHPGAAGGNEALHRTWEFGDVEAAFAEADVVASERLVVHRHSAAPIECLAAIVSHDPLTKQTTAWASIGNLNRYTAAARALKLDNTDVRLIVPDVGGSFGLKVWLHQRVVLLAVLSRKISRPVKWLEDRVEHLMASHHGTGRIAYVEMGAKRDGTLLGLRMRFIDDQGAYVCLNEPFGPTLILMNGVTGCYSFRNVKFEAQCVLTNKVPVASMRGYGRVQFFFALERMVDRVARELGMDPAELRMKNFIPSEAYPYLTPSKTLYDSGDPAALLNKAKELLDYDNLRREQAEARKTGRLLGIGWCASVEGGGANMPQLALGYGIKEKSGLAVDVATIQIGPDGRLSVQAPTLSQGQGHETTIAQIVADRFGVDPSKIKVTVQFDSATMPYSVISGTYSSRFSSSGALAVYGAAEKLSDQLALLAGKLLEADPRDIEFAEEQARVRGAPQRSVPLRQLAATAHVAPDSFEMGSDVGLQATYRSNWPSADAADENGLFNGMNTFSVLVHAAVVEVDPESGKVRVLKYVATEDCGRLINPAIVRGQAMGGLVNGLGWSFTEDFVYDQDGQLLTGTFMDYLLPRFTDIPPLQMDHIECPTPFSPLGAKGMGEGGSIPAPTCLANAVEDAIAHLGGKIRDSHMPPETVLQAIRQPPTSSLQPSGGRNA